MREGLVKARDLRKRVAADLTFRTDGLENRHALLLALHPHPVHFPVDEALDRSHDVLGDENAHAVFLGEIFEARGEVHRVAHHRIGTAEMRAHVADAHRAAVEADANAEQGPTLLREQRSSPRSAFCMARPHSSARLAWSASRTGAPQKAMIASPMYLSTVPRRSWMQIVIRVK